MQTTLTRDGQLRNHSGVQARPSFEFSHTGKKLTSHSGIVELMDDLGRAVTTQPDMRMLGGGNPAPVPAFQQLVRARMLDMLNEGDAFERMLAYYDPPQGNPRFIRAFSSLLQRSFQWPVGPENIAVTCGGQSAFFNLFNLLAGRFEGNRRRKILLPLAPEYIGYADQGLEPDLFVACRPQIRPDPADPAHRFKYRIDFDAVRAVLEHQDIGAIAASRPTNPSGNVLTDAEVQRLARLAEERGIPLIIDNAYGAPFPGILFVPAASYWAPNVILTFSLSKLGLPGTRTGIIVAPAEIVSAISSMTGIIGLANNTIGQQLVLPWIEDGSILNFGAKFFRPFYEAKRRQASAWLQEACESAGVDWAVHVNEGAFFFWLWLRDLSISSRSLYERLKARQVLTVPGEYFFFGGSEHWPHARQCLRLNYSGPEQAVREGFQIIAEEAVRARQ